MEDGISRMPLRRSARFAKVFERRNQKALARRKGDTRFKDSEKVVSSEEHVLKRADALAQHIVTKYGTTTSDHESLGQMRKHYRWSLKLKELADMILKKYKPDSTHQDPSHLVVLAQVYQERRLEESSSDEG